MGNSFSKFAKWAIIQLYYLMAFVIFATVP